MWSGNQDGNGWMIAWFLGSVSKIVNWRPCYLEPEHDIAKLSTYPIFCNQSCSYYCKVTLLTNHDLRGRGSRPLCRNKSLRPRCSFWVRTQQGGQLLYCNPLWRLRNFSVRSGKFVSVSRLRSRMANSCNTHTDSHQTCQQPLQAYCCA